MTELEKAKAKVAELEAKEKTNKRDKYIRKLEDVSDEEKIEFFDNMFNDALKMLEDSEIEGYIEHEIESQLKILAKKGENIRDYFNKL